MASRRDLLKALAAPVAARAGRLRDDGQSTAALAHDGLSAALPRLRRAVGAEWVFTSDEDLAPYLDPYSPLRREPNELRAVAAVAPASIEEVQAVVAIANQQQIALHPISTGRNLGYGGPAPASPGGVVLDLKRMNRILDIDADTGFCVVEPGVSFFQLYEELRARSLNLWIPTPEPGWGSPIGNALERGVSYLQGDNFAALCGMEVILPTGLLVRTGGAALGGSTKLTAFRYGFGPMLEGLFVQSNFGIVTKIGFKLQRQPQTVRWFKVACADYGSCDALFRTLRDQHDLRLIRPVATVNCPLQAQTGALALMDEDTPEAWAALTRMAAESGKPCFEVRGSVAGPAAVADAHMEHLRRAFESVDGSVFSETERLDFPADEGRVRTDLRTQVGRPSLAAFADMMSAADNFGHFNFQANLPFTGAAFRAANRDLRAACRRHGGEAAAVAWGVRAAATFFPDTLTLTRGFFVSADPKQNARNRALVQSLMATAAAKGWSEHRPHAIFHETAMSNQRFNGDALRRLLETLKDALDPNGVLAPGRAGIWPRRLRAGLVRKALILLVGAALGFGVAPGGGARAAAPEGEVAGKVAFDRWCAACHARVDLPTRPPATVRLQTKYGGRLPPALEDRKGLSPAMIKAIVRSGRLSMPPTRKTELSDADLDALAAYLARAD